MMETKAALALIAVLLCAAPLAARADSFTVFEDVSNITGIRDDDTDKTGSPVIADLDGDGYLDIVMVNHKVSIPVDIYYGRKDGTFLRAVIFTEHKDRHGAALGDYNSDGLIDVAISAGPVFKVDLPGLEMQLKPREWKNINPSDVGLDERRAPSCSARFVDLDNDGDLDFFLQARDATVGPTVGGPQHFVYENVGGKFIYKPNTGIEYGPDRGVLFTDYDGDGFLDMVLVERRINLFKNNGDFTFRDVTEVAIPVLYARALGGIIEMDYDNDGDFDLYIASGFKGRRPQVEDDDILLENQNGVFVDVSDKANLPKKGAHIGSSAGDFNNDGWLDIFHPRAGVTTERPEDAVMMSNGDGTFSEPFVDHGAPTWTGETGEGVGSAVMDYNGDGRVDVVVASREDPGDGAALKLFKNVLKTSNNYIFIDLPIMDKNGHTSMDAVITITVGDRKLTRKAGPSGSEFRGGSHIDCVHFGLGSATQVDSVFVKFTGGGTYTINEPITEVNRVVQVGPDVLHTLQGARAAGLKLMKKSEAEFKGLRTGTPLLLERLFVAACLFGAFYSALQFYTVNKETGGAWARVSAE